MQIRSLLVEILIAPCLRRVAFALLSAWLTVIPLLAQPANTSPKAQFGFQIGDDYQLANYTQLAAYWRKLAAESPRFRVAEIGSTAEGRTQLMAIITAPENFVRLDRFREIARRLALAENLTETEARALAQEGKAVVWID
ncbi:MAG: peptidase, partial [Acidobacteriota bacterium]|nr:peptidase [Acidobacteriota bacterium]